ncbi:MAG: hypothetical protein ABJI22_15530 [Maribacter sp.]
MNTDLKKIFQYLLIALLFGFIFYNWNTKRDLSFEQAGTDFTQSFNNERKKMNLPILPNNWYNTHPLHYKIQVWKNPDTILPQYSEKTVAVTTRAEFDREIDRYNLKKVGNKFYQVVIEFSKTDSLWTCSLRETSPPEREGKSKGIRYSGTIISELTLEQANDTLKKHGIKRLNY